jgi:hypothetical protein
VPFRESSTPITALRVRPAGSAGEHGAQQVVQFGRRHVTANGHLDKEVVEAAGDLA